MNRESAKKYVEYIESLMKDNGIRSRLKRSIIAENEVSVYRYIMPWCQYGNMIDENKRKTLLFIASAMALLNESDKTPYKNIGDSLKEIQKKGISEGSTDKYFSQICDSFSMEELICSLTRLIYLCKSKSINVNMENLLLDIYWWESPEGKEKTIIRWAESLYK